VNIYPTLADSSNHSLSNWQNLALISISIIIGATTHILWDSFTHPTFWPYRHWHLLSQTLQLPLLGKVECYKLLQHVSTMLGILALIIWWTRLPRASSQKESSKVPLQAWGILVIAILGSVLRASVGGGVLDKTQDIKTFLAEATVTAITLMWIQLILYGIIRDGRPE
jgi:hypothetical protein